ncbi:MAG: hypothetical protein AAF423_08465 [Pseudomonadota bacterium]
MDYLNIKKLSATSFLGCVLAISLLPSQAAAQAMSPMRGQVKSFTEAFALKVYPANPYNHRIRMEIKVYDQNFRPVKGARVSPAEFTLGGRFARPVNVIVPFDGQKVRKVRVCTESIPFPSEQKATTIKAQVCGKFLGERIQ